MVDPVLQARRCDRVFVCVSEDKERMETAGGPELHRPALVPALHSLLRRHGEPAPP